MDTGEPLTNILARRHERHIDAHKSLILSGQEGTIVQIADLLVNRSAIAFGNGGSMADSIHFAAELVGRYKTVRKPLPAIALCDPASLTCIGNDYSFEDVFARQLEAHYDDYTVAVVFSTSGVSANIVAAIKKAEELGIPVVMFTKRTCPDNIKAKAKYCIIFDTEDTAVCQELTIMVVHMICEVMDELI